MDDRILRIEETIARLTSEAQGVLNRITSQDQTLRDALDQYVQQAETHRTGLTTRVEGLITATGGSVARIDSEQANLGTRLDQVEHNIQGITPENTNTAQGVIQQLVLSDLPGMVQGISLATQRIGIMATEIQALQAHVTYQSANPGTNGRQDDTNRTPKMITEYKAIEQMSPLSNEKSTFRDWRVRFRTAYKGCTKAKGWREIMQWLENPAKRFGNESGPMEVKKLKEDFMMDNQSNQNTLVKDGDWEIMMDEMEAILMMKSADKSEPFLLTKRF